MCNCNRAKKTSTMKWGLLVNGVQTLYGSRLEAEAALVQAQASGKNGTIQRV